MSDVLLWRILGNDIEGRHLGDCTHGHLKNILTNEGELNGCTKRFLINRVADPIKLRMLRDLLITSGADFSEIPFQRDVYRNLPENDKVTYLTNQAAAKNYCLDYGKENGHDYIIPADSSVWFSSLDWDSIQMFVDPVYGLATDSNNSVSCLRVYRSSKSQSENRENKLMMTPEDWKLPSGMSLLCPPEPQLMFHASNDLRYSSKVPYGFVNLEMLTRLNIEGPWDRLPMVETEKIDEIPIVTSGSCVKMPSGFPEIDLDGLKRYSLRSTFAKTLVSKADELIN
jgi:hypothetical protein